MDQAQQTDAPQVSAHRHYIDIASERLGGAALLASDEFFASKENLLKPGRGVFIEDKYTEQGKWMDGWESRRKRTPGHDWCIIRLGLPGVVRALTIDTNHFKGNAPLECSVDGCVAPANATGEHLASQDDLWKPLLGKGPVQPHFENEFTIDSNARLTHVRLNIFPDGGVARFRVLGEVRPDWNAILATDAPIDLAAVQHGGMTLACSDEFFGRPGNMLMPGRAANMGDGWETKRRRGPGYDWCVLRLGARGLIERIVIDTNHFKGNYPDSCDLEVCDAPGASVESLKPGAPDAPHWRTAIARTKLEAHTEREFVIDGDALGEATHARLNIYPDGGVSRLRIFGRPDGGAEG